MAGLTRRANLQAEALENLARGRRLELRQSDLLARTGSQEFVVVLPETGADDAQRIVEGVRQRTPQRQTCSAGIATLKPGDTAESFLARADRAMYAANNRGRGNVVFAEG